MTVEEAQQTIKEIPIGAKLQLVKSNGEMMDVILASHEVEGVGMKKYETVVVPELPPALIVQGRGRFGNFRVEVEDLIKIAWVA